MYASGGGCFCLVMLFASSECYLAVYYSYMLMPCIQVSASFAASLVTSPAIGAYLGRAYSDNLVIALASFVAILDVCFLLLAVPESLPEKCRPATWGSHIAWEKADPFAVNNLFAALYMQTNFTCCNNNNNNDNNNNKKK